MNSVSVISDIACVIIAGGKASRLDGQVKALIDLGDGTTILDRQLAVLRSRSTTIAISANDPAPYAHTGLPVLPDRELDKGPMAGLAAALAWCRRPYLLAVASDMPYLDVRLIDLLLSRRARGVDMVVPYHGDHPEPLCTLYHRQRLIPVVDAHLASGRLRTADLAEDADLHVARVYEPELRAIDPDLRFLTNVNTPESLAAVRQQTS